MTKGWKLESARHALAAKGMETGRKTKPKSALFGSRTPDLEQIIRAIKTSDEYYAHPTKNEDKWDKFIEEEIKHDLEKGNITDIDEYIKTKAENLSIQFDEEDPIGTVIISNPDGTEQKIQLGEYQDLDLTASEIVEDGSDFTPKWHSTDAWRGYYEIEAKGWEQLHSDTALSYSEDETELKKFNDELKKKLAEVGIPLATVITRTSNLFSSSVDYYVPTGKKAEVEKIAEQLKKKYRDEERFTSTALTGADPKKQTSQDKQFVKAVKRMHETGEAPEKVVKEIIHETKRAESMKH